MISFENIHDLHRLRNCQLADITQYDHVSYLTENSLLTENECAKKVAPTAVNTVNK